MNKPLIISGEDSDVAAGVEIDENRVIIKGLGETRQHRVVIDPVEINGKVMIRIRKEGPAQDSQVAVYPLVANVIVVG
jgi:hypothetical protein